MKIFLPILLVFILAIAFLVAGGFYPVAWVGSSPLAFRTWEQAVGAAERFTNAQTQSAPGGKTVDFNSPANINLLQEVKRGTLNFLIEDMVLQQEGKGLVYGFETLSRDRAAQALTQGDNLEGAIKLVYGLDLENFRRLVLLPQSRRDMAAELLQERGENFAAWFTEVKKKKKVRLMFVPFNWDGEAVR